MVPNKDGDGASVPARIQIAGSNAARPHRRMPVVRPHVMEQDLEDAYAQIAQDEEREAEACNWCEALISYGIWMIRCTS